LLAFIRRQFLEEFFDDLFEFVVSLGEAGDRPSGPFDAIFCDPRPEEEGYPLFIHAMREALLG
jgi:hypothetical protein